jgi:hypothetical protein
MVKYISKCSFQILFLTMFALMLQAQFSYSAASNNQPKLIRTIANYKIYKFDKNFYATVKNELDLENNKVVLSEDLIIEEKLSFVEKKIINLLDVKPLFYATMASYNIVIYSGKVFGVPQGQTINWEDANYISIPGLILGASIDEVHKQIIENPRSWQPILLDELLNFNVVKFKDKFYGVPHGYNVDFYQDNLSNDNLLIIANSSTSVKIIIIKNTILVWVNRIIH